WNPRQNAVLLRKITLIHCNGHAASRVDVNERLPDWHRRKRLLERECVLLEADLQGDLISKRVAKLLEIVSVNVGDQTPERIVQADHLAGNAFRVYRCHARA